MCYSFGKFIIWYLSFICLVRQVKMTKSFKKHGAGQPLLSNLTVLHYSFLINDHILHAKVPFI